MTPTTTLTAVSTLAAATLTGALGRANVVGADKKGRTLVEMTGTPTAAEAEWSTLRGLLALVRLLRTV